MPLAWHLQSRTPSAIAIIQLTGDEAELEAIITRLALAPFPSGRVALRNILNIDRALVARFAPSSITLFPHGSPAVIRALARQFAALGIPEITHPALPSVTYPEAPSLLHARMLAALARAASPLAIDLLLDQPRRWATGPPDPADPRHTILRRLIDPPLIVAIGPSNIGKSSLLNALAGRGISLVADEPGTTRDHIGALIDFAGLTARYIDTPGIRPDAEAIELDALQLAAKAARSADLILSCGDLTAPPPPSAAHGQLTFTLALRADLGLPTWPCDHAVSILTGRGVSELVSAIRDALVPPELLTNPRPWAFD